MKSSITFAITSVFVIFSLAEAKKQCGFVCNEWDWGFGNETIAQLFIAALKKEGPADGICLKKDKWILDGKDFGLPTHCVCLDIPTDIEIKPGQGPRCADLPISSPEETLVEYWRRCYESVKSFAPPNGWCPKGQIKWIIRGERIGRPADTCFCINDYKVTSTEVKCIEMPSSSSSSLEGHD